MTEKDGNKYSSIVWFRIMFDLWTAGKYFALSCDGDVIAAYCI